MLFWRTRKIYSIWKKEKVSGKYPWLPSEGASELLYNDNNRWRNPVFTQWERTRWSVRRVCREKSLSLCWVTLKHVYVSRNNRPFKTFFIASSMPNVYFCASEMSSHFCKNSWINSIATSPAITGQRYSGLPVPNPSPCGEEIRNVCRGKKAFILVHESGQCSLLCCVRDKYRARLPSVCRCCFSSAANMRGLIFIVRSR